MILIMLGLVVDAIWRSFYFSRWYSSLATTAYLSLQIMAMVWEAKATMAIQTIPDTLEKGRWAICNLISIHFPVLDPDPKTSLGALGERLPVGDSDWPRSH